MNLGYFLYCPLTQTSAYYCGVGSILACIFSNESIVVLIKQTQTQFFILFNTFIQHNFSLNTTFYSMSDKLSIFSVF